MDRVPPNIRSRTMAAIKGCGTSIERTFGALVSGSRFSFVEHPKWLGSPDFAFPKRGVVVFLDSCFWHKCPAHYRPPKSRTEYWQAKIARNVDRDATIRASYQEQGWLVIQFWEHSMHEDAAECLNRLLVALRSRNPRRWVPPPPKRTPGGGVKFNRTTPAET